MIIFYILEVVGCTKVRVSCAYHCVVVRGFVMYMAVPCLWGFVAIYRNVDMLVVAEAVTAVNVMFTATVIVVTLVVGVLVVRAAVSFICLVLALVVVFVVLIVFTMAVVVVVLILFVTAVMVLGRVAVVAIVKPDVMVLCRAFTYLLADLLHVNGLLLRQIIATLV